jgi:hypothetical protein
MTLEEAKLIISNHQMPMSSAEIARFKLALEIVVKQSLKNPNG